MQSASDASLIKRTTAEIEMSSLETAQRCGPSSIGDPLLATYFAATFSIGLRGIESALTSGKLIVSTTTQMHIACLRFMALEFRGLAMRLVARDWHYSARSTKVQIYATTVYLGVVDCAMDDRRCVDLHMGCRETLYQQDPTLHSDGELLLGAVEDACNHIFDVARIGAGAPRDDFNQVILTFNEYFDEPELESYWDDLVDEVWTALGWKRI